MKGLKTGLCLESNSHWFCLGGGREGGRERNLNKPILKSSNNREVALGGRGGREGILKLQIDKAWCYSAEGCFSSTRKSSIKNLYTFATDYTIIQKTKQKQKTYVCLFSISGNSDSLIKVSAGNVWFSGPLSVCMHAIQFFLWTEFKGIWHITTCW